MNESGGLNFGSSRARVGTSNEPVDGERTSKIPIAHNSTSKRNSWTSLVTKARRSSKKRKTPSSSSLRTKKESDNNAPKTDQSCAGKNLEDYTSWCNHYLLRGLHREISPDLRTAVGDGVTLINFVESLTSKSIHGVLRHPITWSQKLENIQLCFGFLESEGVRLNDISPEDIIEGQWRGILSLFQHLETHFEYSRYHGGNYKDKNQSSLPADNGKNGQISSGYHTEDDGYFDNRATLVVDALPGLLVGNGPNSESDDDALALSDICMHHHNREAKSPHQSSSDAFHSASCDIDGATTRFCRDPSASRHSRSARTLDNIGYMPSHPSTKARMSAGDKTEYGEHEVGTTSAENHSPNQRTVITTSHVKMASSGHAVLLSPAEDHGLDNFGLEFTASDFGIDDTMSEGRGSISSTGTPILPDLSSTSSFEDLPLDFSSDASGLARENFSTSTNLYQDAFDEGRSNSSVDIQKQVESLHSMYHKLLVLVDKDSQDVKRKTKWNLPKMAAVQAKTKSATKQRTKDMKSVGRRFNRIESNIVTLARSIDHLRSEVRSQADASRQLDELRADLSDFKDSVYSHTFHARHSERSTDYKRRLHRLQKLKSFFGEEPPMVSLLLQRMGYERFIPHFKAEEIGILELPYVTEQRLQNLGIPLGPRLRILEEIQKLQ